MTALKDTFTSTGHKFFAHEEAMRNLRNGKGQSIVTHVIPTDRCQDTCAFCSVQHRAGDALPLADICGYLDILLKYGLKAVIVSGGGNPILYRCPKEGYNFNHLIEEIHARGLEIGLITNGAPLSQQNWPESVCGTRLSWKMVKPETLDRLTWIRISMSGLDHERGEVEVPEIDSSKTTLGFSWVAHDVFWEPADKAHGKVSTQADLITLDRTGLRTWTFDERIPEVTRQLIHYAKRHHPRYMRLLPNCLEVPMIGPRCEQLRTIAAEVNQAVGYEAAFVQHKPPAAPPACYLGYIHPVLNCDGFVYPCDSCVLNEAAGHSFANPWRICRWDEIGQIYEQPVRSLIADPAKQCPGCVFTHSNIILGGVVDGTADITPPTETPEHANFV